MRRDPGWDQLPLGDHILAESPRWEPATATLSWVDCVARTLCWSTIAAEDSWGAVSRRSFDALVTAAVPDEESGGWWVAAGSQLRRVTRAGEAVGDPLPVSPRFPAVRTNDMVRGPRGRLLVGLFTEDRHSPLGSVWSVDPATGEAWSVVGDLVTSNGLGFSPDASLLYVVDTARGALSRHSYDPDSGQAEPGTPLIRWSGPGVLDGITVDSAGHIWVAVWDAAQVHRYSADGELLEALDTPVRRPSAVALVGPAEDVLVVTTARLDIAEPVGGVGPDRAGRLYGCAVTR